MALAQLTDLHVGASWCPADPLDTLATVIDAVRALPQPPQAVIVTGDLANEATDDQYARARAALDRLGVPYYVLAGNHDDRAALRRHFALPGGGDDAIQYVIELDGLQVLMLDTLRPGEDAGELGPWRLGWVATQLAAAPDTPTLLAMHHPPFLTGMVGMDGIALPRADRDGLAELVAAHPQVCGVVAGHVHRAIAAQLAGRCALTIPSTYAQLPLDLAATDLGMIAAPLAFALHTLVDGRLVSHVQTLAATADASR